MPINLTIESLAIPEIKLIKPKIHRDHRGFVCETMNNAHLQEMGINPAFVQENLSVNAKAGTVRGLHFQTPPHAQAKFIRVTRGKIYDVAVDMRHGSPTFGRFIGVTLSSDEPAQLYIPAGFAHGFCSLVDDTEVLYKMSVNYAPGYEAGIIWNDPDLNIPWPVDTSRAILSSKDQDLPAFGSLQPYFRYSDS
ncbi:MAG: dTDP-4-dehydrorhamnose 3,5-epimerase [Alphaproteobacteria bacterium]|nr:dTDP-4-dehydrorhamnose 3,5-epimerase [Alphaproteobacteria bacterium]